MDSFDPLNARRRLYAIIALFRKGPPIRDRIIPFLCALFISASTAGADTLRLAYWHLEWDARGPGLLAQGILENRLAALPPVTEILLDIRPDMLVLSGFDYDVEGVALSAFKDHLGKAGLEFPHVVALSGNAGRRSNLDLDGDGRLREAEDSWGFGAFQGAGAMAVLSTQPITEVQNASDFLWRDLPNPNWPITPDGTDFYSDAIKAEMPLAAKGFYAITLAPLQLLISHASPPVFDGPEDANGRRQSDEMRFWDWALAGNGPLQIREPFALMAGLNADMAGGEGDQAALGRLLSHPRLQDPLENTGPTVDWRDPTPGDLRVDYILPSRALTVLDGGVFWPKSGPKAKWITAAQEAGSRHKLIWVDVILP